MISRKHVQLNRARLMSYGVLREEIKTYCECRGHAARNVRQKGPSHPGGNDPMDIGAFGKGKGKQSKGKHGKGKDKGKQGQQGQHGQDRDRSKDKNKDSVECWNCGKRGHHSKDCWFKKNTKGGSKGKHKPKNTVAPSRDSKPSIAEPEVEIDEFSMTYFNLDALQESEKVRGSEWIKIGVDTGAGKTAWPQSITYGTMVPDDSDLTFRAATGEHVKGGKRMQIVKCDDLGIQSQDSRCSTTGVQTTVVCREIHDELGVTVLDGDKGYMFRKVSHIANQIDAWVQKELRGSQYQGCTVAHKENNVYNIYVKPRKTRLIRCHCLAIQNREVAGWSEPVRPENPEVPGGARDPEVPRRSTRSRSSRRST